MPYKPILVALLGLFLTGCAVYGDGYGHRYPGYDRHYSAGHYQGQRYPVYVAPRHYRYDDRRHAIPSYDKRSYDKRHDRRRFDAHRHDQRRYLPAPQSRHYNHDRRTGPRHEGRRDQRRQDYRAEQPRKGWSGQHFKLQERTPKYQRHDKRSRSDYRRGGERRRN